MPIMIQFANEDKTIIHCILTEKWTIQEAQEAMDFSIAHLLPEISHVPDVIVEFRNTNHIPTGVLQLWRYIYNWREKHQFNAGIVVFLTAPVTSKAMFRTMSTMRLPITKNLYFVDDWDTAHQTIANHRSKQLYP